MSGRVRNRNWLVIGAAIGALIGLGSWQAGLSPLLAYLAGINACALALYAFDKLQARRNRWRVPETILHMTAALGGTPGAFVGQIIFRHKTRKTGFRRIFWLILALQVAGLGIWWFAIART